MTTVTLRPVSADEFDAWRQELARDYAASQVGAGRWDAEGALDRALADFDGRLPQGRETPGVLLVIGVDDDGARIGRAWIAIDPDITASGIAFLFDIEVDAARRGEGLGRGLLDAVEAAVRENGATALELNVFGSNEVARSLYASAGYEIVTQQLRKTLG